MNHVNREGSICSLFYHKFWTRKTVQKGYAGRPMDGVACFDMDKVKKHCKNCLSYEPKLDA